VVYSTYWGPHAIDKTFPFSACLVLIAAGQQFQLLINKNLIQALATFKQMEY